MFHKHKKHSIQYYESSYLSGCDFLTHAFCTRLGGVSKEDYKSLNISFKEGDMEDRVLQNWYRLAMAFAIPVDYFLTLNQVHGDDILVIKPYGNYLPEEGTLNYDAIVTTRENLAICIKTADCVPVFIVDRVKKIIAAVHAGWKSTALEISAKVTSLFFEKYRSSEKNLLAAIGPAIGQCCFEIDEKEAKPFQKQKDHEAFLLPSERKDKWIVDLAESNRRQIINSGIPEENIDISNLCTSCRHDLFFSYRRSGGVTGRQLNFIMIKGEAPCRVLTIGDEHPHFQKKH
ncbi:MAG: peptidoglycan editing factor PgeF [Syntrophaceae bacterium]|nr:peptidoglycan editing factor PgeF [Syntrophaceae bacterium]